MKENSAHKEISRRRFFSKFATGIAGTAIGFSGLENSFALNGTPSGLPASVNPTDEKYWEMIRKQFLLKPEKIYFNTAALGPSPRVVVDTLINTMMQLEEISEHGHRKVHLVNEKAASFLHALPEEIAITRNTTEGMNIIARGLPLKKGDEVIMSTHEHPGGAIPWLGLKNDIGIAVKLFEPGKTQEENLDIIKQQISGKTKVISISHTLCTTGLIFPVKEISRLCRERNIFFVLDGAHPPGMIPIDLHDIGVDFFATSGHKWLLGPKGTGILYIRKEMFRHWRPTYVGAYSDDKYILERLLFEHKANANCTEYGTRNTPLILALGAAIDFMQTIGMENVAARGKAMATYFMKALEKIPEQVDILTPSEEISRASIVTFRPKNMDFLELARHIQRQARIRLRTVPEHHLNAIRCSFHVFNNFEEVDKLVFTIKKILR